MPRFDAFRALAAPDPASRRLAAINGDSAQETPCHSTHSGASFLTLSLAAMLAALMASPVAAGSKTQVGGMLTPDTGQVCLDDAASVATYTVTGDLIGLLVHRRVDDPERNTVRIHPGQRHRAVRWLPRHSLRELLDDVHVHLQGRERHRGPWSLPSPDRRRRRRVRRREGRAPDARPAERVRDLQGPPLLLTATRQPPGDRAARADRAAFACPSESQPSGYDRSRADSCVGTSRCVVRL